MAQPKQPSLTVLGGPLAGSRFPLTDGAFVVGSDAGSSFHLPLPGVGASHARIESGPTGVSIHQAGDPRGLHVNDTQVGPEGVALRNGDIVWLGTPGEPDVVMLQCILPPRSVSVPRPAEAVPVPPAPEAVVELAAEVPPDSATLAFRPAPAFEPQQVPEPAYEIEASSLEAEEPQLVEADLEPTLVEPELVAAAVEPLVVEPVVEPELEVAEVVEAESVGIEPEPMLEVAPELVPETPTDEFVAEEGGFDVVPPMPATPADDAAALIEAELGGVDGASTTATATAGEVEYVFDEPGIESEPERFIRTPPQPAPPSVAFEDETHALPVPQEEATFVVGPDEMPRPDPTARYAKQEEATVLVPPPVWQRTPPPPEPTVLVPPPPPPQPASRPVPPLAPRLPPAQVSAPRPAPNATSVLPRLPEPPMPRSRRARLRPYRPQPRRVDRRDLCWRVVGAVVLALLGGGFAVWKFVLSKPTPEPTPVAQAAHASPHAATRDDSHAGANLHSRCGRHARGPPVTDR